MKKIIGCLFLILPLFAAKVDRSKAPTPGQAPEVKIGDYQSFELENGLKVYVVENHKLPTLNISLQLDRDPVLEKDRAGYIDAAGQLLMRGTKTRSKLQLDEEIDFLGARVRTTSRSLFAECLSKHSDALFELIGDIILNPSFPESELTKIKTEMDAGLQSMKDDPDAIIERVRAAVSFGKNHPYGELLTPESLAKFTVEDCRSYYQTYFRPNIGFLSIVGDISLPKAKELVMKHLGSWEKKDVPTHTYETPVKPKKPQVIIVNKEGAVQTLLCLCDTVDYKISDADYMAGLLMNAILGGGGGRRLYNNLREEKGFTYGAYSRLVSDPLTGSFSAEAKVRNEVTKDAVKAFQAEFNRIRTEPVPEEEMKQVKAYVAGSFVRSLEEPSTISQFAINTAIHNLPKTFYHDYLKSIENISQEQIMGTAKNYIPGDSGYIFAIGNTDTLKKDLADFGDIAVLDINANPVREVASMPEGMTASIIIEGYLAAIGGKEKLDAIKSIASTGTFSTMGMELQYKDFKSEPGKFAMEISMNGQPMVKQILNSQKGYVMQMGQRKDFSEQEAAEMKNRSVIFPELHWATQGIITELSGIENLDGINAYKIQLTEENGKSRTVYYDMTSYLKIKALSSEDGPQGPIQVSMEITGYQDFGGVKMPSEIKIQQGPQLMKMTLTDIQINPTIEESAFKVD